MGNNGSSEMEFNFICLRCNRVIEPGEKMLTVSTSIERPTEGGEIDVIGGYVISALCLGCASILINESVISNKFTMPEEDSAMSRLVHKNIRVND